MSYVLQLHFRDSNNAIEYEALLHGLCIVASMGRWRLIYQGDSDLIVQQVMFDGIELHHIKRSDNMAADSLARIGVARDPLPKEKFLKILNKPSIKMQDVEGSPPTSNEEDAEKESRPTSGPIQDMETPSQMKGCSPSYQTGLSLCSRTWSMVTSQQEKLRTGITSTGPRHIQ